jgi:hypothetical protein
VAERVLVRRAARPSRAGQQLALMIAGDRRPAQRHQFVAGLPRPQWSRQNVAAVDDLVHAPTRHVGQHGLQRRQVAMNVGQDGDAHHRPQVVAAPFMAALTMRA